MKIFGLILLILVLFGGVYFFIGTNRVLIWPMRIIGGDPGNFKVGDIVLVASIKTFNLELQKSDVIMFNFPIYKADNKIAQTAGSEMIGELIGKAGDNVNDQTYYYNNEKIEGHVPGDHYLVELNNGSVWRAVPADFVIGKVIYPKK